MSRRTKIILQVLAVIIALLWLFSLESGSNGQIYGASFSRFHSDELGLNWKETFLALQNDLKIKHFRFSAHWPLTEPEKDKYNFEELDFQMNEARKNGSSVILAVGRRLPGWPECHEPEWLIDQISKIKDQNARLKFRNEQLLRYIETVVNRYKNYDNLIYWQIENEPFLTYFSRSACGTMDKEFLDREIEFVRSLDPSRKIVITDSGEFGPWFQAYSRADVFGTSLYLYVWPRSIGLPIRYPITPAFFRIKKNIVSFVFGSKPSFVAELSAEPWLLQPIVDTTLEIQLERMGLDKFNYIVDFSGKTGFREQYFWGAEWWYWLKQKGYPEHWERVRELFIK